MRKDELIDSRTQKTIVQHNWLKDHEFVSAYGTRYRIAGLLGLGFSESYLAAFKLDAAGDPIRVADTGRPKLERLATTIVIEQLNARGIYAPWDQRSKGAMVESGEEEVVVTELELDEVPEIEEPKISEKLSKSARDQAEAKLAASIANLGGKRKSSPEEILL
jgi:hypothetical protein